MAEVYEIAAELTKETTEVIEKHEAASKYVQVAIALSGGAVAICHGLTLSGQAPAYIHELSLLFSVVVALASVYLLYLHAGPSKALATAHRALECVRERQRELEELEESLTDATDSVQRAIDLYVATQDMQAVAQNAISDLTKADIDCITLLLNVSLRSLVIACGFANRDTWTLAVFKADPPTPMGTLLRCVALERSAPCEVARARTWREGQGVSGVTYSTKRETAVHDLLNSDWKQLSNDDGILSSAEDKLKYRSAVGIPILPNNGASARPWGVVVATSDKVGHFGEPIRPGLHPVHAVRALTSMIELVIRIKQIHQQLHI